MLFVYEFESGYFGRSYRVVVWGSTLLFILSVVFLGGEVRRVGF